MFFTIKNCDVGIKYNGVSYDFEHVNEVVIEDNQRTMLTRGANAKNKIGLVYTDGLREAVTWTIPIMDMSLELKGVLDEAHKNHARLDVYVIDRATGSAKWAKNAVLANKPQQLTLDETPESIQVSLEFKTFDSSEVLKDA